VSELIISVSGLRGIVGENLSPEVAIRYGCAFARDLPPGKIVIGRDGRSTGNMLGAALAAGLTAAGREVIDAGVAATPTLGVLVCTRGAAGGIQISASHNPPQYNGLKLFSAAGRVIPADAGQRVLDRYRRPIDSWVPYDEVGAIEPCEDPLQEHLALVLAQINVQAIRRRRYRVLLDSNHGAGSLLGLRLLYELDCHVVALGADPDGQFEHVPEPTAENLASVLPQLTSAGADVGFCQDPDADRLAVIDQRGRYLGEEYTLALCVDHLLRKQPGPIVTNCSSSRMAEDLAALYKVPFHRSAVGEANVVDAMLAHGAVLGGEGNGGVIDPRVVLVRDSFVGMAMILDAMAERDLPVDRLADELPYYEIVKTKISIERERISAALEAVERQFPEARADRMDGLRLDWPGKWLLVRASNTEPIVRAIAEAPTAAEAQLLCDLAAKAMAG
jgi:phosphomannomutase